MKEELVLLLFFFGGSLTANVALLMAWRRSARRLRELEADRAGAEAPADPRTERLERSVEALTAQVDQLTNEHEFLNRLVAERLVRSAHPLAPPDRPNTPH